MKCKPSVGEKATQRLLSLAAMIVVMSCLVAYPGSLGLRKALASNPAQVQIRTPREPNAAPVKVFHVNPPALFKGDQLPNHGLVEFRLSGNARQTLAVRLSNPKVFIKALQGGIGDTRLALAGDSENRLYVLPQTGSYRFLLDLEPNNKTNLQFDFLSSSDPMIDPGIDPHLISVDFGSFATAAKLAPAPYTFNDEEDYLDSWPAHLALERKDFEFRVMLISAYHAIFKDDDDRMAQLVAALQREGTDADVTKFPYPVYLGGGVNVFGKLAFLKGDHWRGLRWIGGFGQDVSCKPDLGYVFEGVSNDGRYFVLVRAKLGNSAQRLWAQDCASAYETGIEKLQQNMIAARPDTFDPALDKLDAVVESLRLQP